MKKTDGKIDGKEKKEDIELESYIEIPTAIETSAFTLPTIDKYQRNQLLHDLHFRVRLSCDAQPSIALYTFLNAQKSVSTATIYKDATMVAAGMSDSTIRFWDITEPFTITHYPAPPSILASLISKNTEPEKEKDSKLNKENKDNDKDKENKGKENKEEKKK